MRYKKGDKQRYSNFLITINTNARMTGTGVPFLTESFRRTIREGFGKSGNLSRLIKFLEPGASYERNIKLVDVTFAVEVGSKVGAIHAHMLIKFTHDTKIHMDPKAIQDFFRKSTGRNPYVDVRVVADDQYVLDYILKGLAPRRQ
jgi:hypothetical protein